ncbi:MAG TPA: L,D-transpeptidase family protein [Xanthomonadales bacterium]|nr:L,D-transpeptidase family protein [Xanthomonadales bacterium]
MIKFTRALNLAAVLILSGLADEGFAAPSDPNLQIRSFVESLEAGNKPLVAGRELIAPQLIERIYQTRNHAPIWLSGGPLENEWPGMLDAIDESVNHGFSPERYHRTAIEQLSLASDGTALLAFELLLTDAFLGQALHRTVGAVNPQTLDPEWQLPHTEVDVVAILDQVVDEKRPAKAALNELWPVDEEYGRLLQWRAEVFASGEVTMVQVPPGPLLKPGHEGERIVLLKERLMGAGEHTAVYNENLRQEVMAFQQSSGLEPDGIVGDHTLEMLNATRGSWIDRLDANLERWRWLPRETPDAYIRVNIAAFVLRAMENGRAALSMDVIVGQPYRRTPVFTETIKYLVLNPFWNVPFSIATRDKLPLLKSDPAPLALNGYEVRTDGSESFVTVDQINWTEVTPRSFRYLLRQRPGAANALGRIKFMLPNPYAVYLHDTPNRELFSRQERAFSSGCIRLEQPLKLAQWLLSREGNPYAKQIDNMLDSFETRTIYLAQPMPAYIVYFTAFSMEDGAVTFRRDIYGRDRLIIDALREQK